MIADVAERARDIGGLSEDCEVRFSVQEHAEAASHDVVVVCQYQRDRARGLLHRDKGIIRAPGTAD